MSSLVKQHCCNQLLIVKYRASKQDSHVGTQESLGFKINRNVARNSYGPVAPPTSSGPPPYANSYNGEALAYCAWLDCCLYERYSQELHGCGIALCNSTPICVLAVKSGH